jgi:hypothetical protein
MLRDIWFSESAACSVGETCSLACFESLHETQTVNIGKSVASVAFSTEDKRGRLLVACSEVVPITTVAACAFDTYAIALAWGMLFAIVSSS